jgi:glycosyltransferase involved in cell wall biosynthesis|tara:strand:+ start:4124 stop:5032 length:909 start_codon:yes stop_codon:yes gene_type:complete
MNIFLENVNLNSNSGPNYFAQKLVKYLNFRNITFDANQNHQLKLTFIESYNQKPWLPMIQRLDGIYFNANFDCNRMNANIKKTYEQATGVIFQTNFNKELIFNWFGAHDNYRIINNGSDLLFINDLNISQQIKHRFETYDNIWSCAAHWHIFKRLEDNIKYFLNFAGENDCLIVAGKSADYRIEHPRIFYVGDLTTNELLSLFKISKYFIHLAYLDHCPNVVIDARACGCKIICSSSGGTKEIAGEDAIVIEEPQWDYSFLNIKKPPQLDYNNKCNIALNSDLSMVKAAKKYYNFFKDVAIG